MSSTTVQAAARWMPSRRESRLSRLFDNKAFLVALCLLPSAGLLLVFLTYPLGLGLWLSLTDATIGQPGEYIGLDNFVSLAQDPVFWMSVTNTIMYTVVATAGKFLLGLWLAMLLNHNIPFKAFIRAIVLLPWIVPTVLSAIAWWWIYDPQFSIVSYVLVNLLHLRSTYIDFLGTPWNARGSLVVANIWRGIPFVAITLLAGLQTISPSLYEAALLDGASGWQKFRRITVPLLMPILSVALTLSVLFTFSDFQLVYAITRGGPFNTTHLMATLAFQRAIPGSQLGEGAAIAVSMIPFLVGATLLCFFGVGRRKWQQGSDND
ncbi:MAG TPA: sugar ABC transporter permease [Acetobacteraceae bacterium]|nr:sugar ABC transporter permease [Acetobacteraceae bacterium]